jgi:hypothetical protein
VKEVNLEGKRSQEFATPRNATPRQPPGEALPSLQLHAYTCIVKAPTGGTGTGHWALGTGHWTLAHWHHWHTVTVTGTGIAPQRNTSIPPLTIAPSAAAAKKNDWPTPALHSPEIGSSEELSTLPCARVELPASRGLEPSYPSNNGGEAIVAWSWVQISCRALSLSTQAL